MCSLVIFFCLKHGTVIPFHFRSICLIITIKFFVAFAYTLKGCTTTTVVRKNIPFSCFVLLMLYMYVGVCVGEFTKYLVWVLLFARRLRSFIIRFWCDLYECVNRLCSSLQCGLDKLLLIVFWKMNWLIAFKICFGWCLMRCQIPNVELFQVFLCQ